MKLEFNRNELIKTKGNLSIDQAIIKSSELNSNEALDALLIEIMNSNTKEDNTNEDT